MTLQTRVISTNTSNQIPAVFLKYRQRNELSDVNERDIIAQYTERQLDRKQQLNK